MANPSLRDGAVDKILTQFSVKYTNEQYISDLIMPEIKVKERTDFLEKANAELDRFVYSASHDLSAPLKSIKGLLRLGQIDPQRDHNKYNNMISESIIKLESVIQSLLQFSKNTSNIVVEEDIVLNELVQGIINELKYLKPDKNITFNVEGFDKNTIKVDTDRLSIILRNIISNAIKYIDLKKKENLISIHYSESEEEHKICVKDNGIGIEKDQLHNIFEMFYRSTDQSSGSGLGLYIVKEALAKIKGEIHVESTQHFGSSFTIVFPK